MKESQEPKYYINDRFKVCNRTTLKAIPDDEPVFIFRAKDRNALAALYHYQKQCGNWNHKAVIGKRIDDFKRFADENPELMKEPDTD